ncbi:hypothetical protein DPMN_164864 [Dreissena polymorpha]|uniref:RING-type domain-containing protein n=1 Tax=Dreissena polymorpha TaxID=45954 RepID=A0A9D4IU34_DREPO|nr:hypothetical protein DPMN_164864 [Dreissena polymorpha]
MNINLTILTVIRNNFIFNEFNLISSEGTAPATAGISHGYGSYVPSLIDTLCLICLDNHSDSVLYQCGHMCVCFPCGRNLMDRSAKCPVCRESVMDIIRANKDGDSKAAKVSVAI